MENVHPCSCLPRRSGQFMAEMSKKDPNDPTSDVTWMSQLSYTTDKPARKSYCWTGEWTQSRNKSEKPLF